MRAGVLATAKAGCHLSLSHRASAITNSPPPPRFAHTPRPPEIKATSIPPPSNPLHLDGILRFRSEKERLLPNREGGEKIHDEVRFHEVLERRGAGGCGGNERDCEGVAYLQALWENFRDRGGAEKTQVRGGGYV